jgi:hypothetical protein
MTNSIDESNKQRILDSYRKAELECEHGRRPGVPCVHCLGLSQGQTVRKAPGLKLRVGQSCAAGTMLTLSRKGNLRALASQKDIPAGVALGYLRRGRMAEEKDPGLWLEVGAVDPRRRSE